MKSCRILYVLYVSILRFVTVGDLYNVYQIFHIKYAGFWTLDLRAILLDFSCCVGAYVSLRTIQLVCQGFREHTELVLIAFQVM